MALDVVRVACERSFEGLSRCGGFTLIEKGVAQIVMGLGHARVYVRRILKAFNGFAKFALILKYIAQIDMGHHIIGFNAERLSQTVDSLGELFLLQ